MSASDSAAVLRQPRLFAIHGLYKRREQRPILGWGMQFADGQGALYTNPHTNTTHNASTAENVLMHLRVVGGVDLVWLTDPAQETAQEPAQEAK
jgi:hypothetical protein